MRRPIALRVLLLGCLAPATAGADTFVVSTTVSTAGWFNCIAEIACSGDGTDSITIASGDHQATLSFKGVTNKWIDITSRAQPFGLGTFQLTATDGFLFPQMPTNSKLPIVWFSLGLSQNAPRGTAGRVWRFGPGGGPELAVQAGRGRFTMPLWPNPYEYPEAIYTVSPFPFHLAPNRTTQLTANVGAVPEPATMLLLGSGVAGAALSRRRRRP